MMHFIINYIWYFPSIIFTLRFSLPLWDACFSNFLHTIISSTTNRIRHRTIRGGLASVIILPGLFILLVFKMKVRKGKRLWKSHKQTQIFRFSVQFPSMSEALLAWNNIIIMTQLLCTYLDPSQMGNTSKSKSTYGFW